MFPFKTKEFSFIVNENIANIKARLSEKIRKRRLMKWYRDYEWVGNFKDNNYIVEQAQFLERNSFRPIITFSLKKIGDHTLVKGYYRLNSTVAAFPFLILGGGIWIAIEDRNIIPLIVTAFFVLIMLVLFINPLFLHGCKKAEKGFKLLIAQPFY